MVSISNLINKQNAQVGFAENELFKKRPFIDISKEDFKTLFLLIANKHIINDGFNHKFIIDSENKECINQMYFWLTGSKMFKGHTLSKGIMLTGPFGTGKTIILKTLTELFTEFTNLRVGIYSALKMPSLIKENGTKEYERKPLFLDEMGKETQQIVDFGNKSQPMIELLSYRYNNNSLTFATTNFDIKDLCEKYDNYIATRLGTMMNIFDLKGKSRRPKLKII